MKKGVCKIILRSCHAQAVCPLVASFYPCVSLQHRKHERKHDAPKEKTMPKKTSNEFHTLIYRVQCRDQWFDKCFDTPFLTSCAWPDNILTAILVKGCTIPDKCTCLHQFSCGSGNIPVASEVYLCTSLQSRDDGHWAAQVNIACMYRVTKPCTVPMPY